MRKPFSIRFDLAQIFGIDPRSLALFRVAMGLVLLCDLCLRASDIGAFYTDAGVLPRAAQIEIYSGLPALLSLHLLNGSAAAQWVLFALAIASALALTLGYRTRLATLVSWVLLVSLHNRNPMVLQGGDVLLRMMLFWSLFLPLAARVSLDNWLATRTNPTAPDLAAPGLAAPNVITPNPTAPARAKYPNGPWVSTGTLAALLQVCFVYWFTAALKTDASWQIDGTAVGYALSIDQLAKPLGRALLGYPDLLRLLTFFTVALERFGPWIALLPFWRSRVFMVAVFCGFHLIMGLCLTLGIFTWIAPASWLLFVPSGAWDWLETRATQLPARAQSTFDVLRARGGTLRLADKLGATSTTAARREPLWRRTLRQGVCAFFLIYVFGWNLRALDFPTYSRFFPQGWNWIGESMRLDQVWNMFSPLPLKEDGWFLAPATLADGKQVNLVRPDAPLSFGEPPNLSGTFRDPVWQKYLLNLWSADNAAHRAYYAAYLVRDWNNNHDSQQRVKAVQIVYMQQTNLPGFRKDKVKKVVLWQQTF